jgi:hypothetical protein
MKKIIYCFLVICLTLSFFPLQSSAATTEKTSSLVATKPPEPADAMEVKALLKRVEVSNSLDKSTLRTNSKTNAQIDRDGGRYHRHGGSVIYISGSLILVIILVVILL